MLSMSLENSGNMNSADSVDAIIVVGPALWKCVNCDLLLSRQHSIDEHLRTAHALRSKRNISLSDSLQSICDVHGCSCHLLSNVKSRNSITSVKKRRRPSGSRAPQFVHARGHTMTVQSDDNDETEIDSNNCQEDDGDDDDEIPQSLRDIVEKVITSKQNAENGHVENKTVCDEVNQVQNAATDFSVLRDDTSVNENSHKFIEDQVTVSKDNPNDCGAYTCGLKSEFSCEVKDRVSENVTLPKQSVIVMDDSELPFLQRSMEMKTDSDHMETQETQDQEPRRRTSSRSNKGKNSQYSEYRMEFG